MPAQHSYTGPKRSEELIFQDQLYAKGISFSINLFGTFFNHK